MKTPYRYHVEIQIPMIGDFECANRDTREECERWAREAEARWIGCKAIITENW